MMWQLTEQQQAAVDFTGAPALVVAGAGAGKTRTLTAKIARLIEEGIRPEQILAITFTNKAADEMKRRLSLLTGLSAERFPWVRTYHSACYRILRRHCDRLGYTPPLQVYAEYQQRKLIVETLLRLDCDKKNAAAVATMLSNAKNTGDPLRYFDANPRIANIRLTDVFEIYERALADRNAVDFDNILLKTRDLLKTFADLRELYRKQFRFILCDEYQDTNDLNEEITALLVTDGNLFVVGDDWQSIYSFRMSNVDHFLTFRKKHPNARIFKLEENFRSVDEIVTIANDLIRQNEYRMDKTCFSAKTGGGVEVRQFPDEGAEAGFVAEKISALAAGGVPLSEIAVLYRTKFTSLAFERALRFRGIPYRMLGGKGFFERKEILDLTCYLTAAVFPKDDAAFERIVNIPRRGVGPGTLSKITRFRGPDTGLQDAVRKALAAKVLPKKVYEGLHQLIGLLDDIRDMAPDAAIGEVIERVGYMDHLQQYAKKDGMDITEREENINQLIYSAGQAESLLDFLEEAALVKEDKEEETADGVNLSTMHAAKGLEFHAVFVVACEEQLMPHWKSIETQRGLEEERRLMYVSITRGERRLYLSAADVRRGAYAPRSRFLDEIEEALIRRGI